MVEIRARYLGGLRTEAVHGPSGSLLETDAPKDNEGRGEAFSPTDLVATALLTCTMTIIGIAARRRGVAVEGLAGRVRKTMAADPHRRIARLEVVLTWPRGLSETDKERFARAAEGCPVRRSLHPDTEVSIRYEDPAD